jgi:GT2 family glycosyltransferase
MSAINLDQRPTASRINAVDVQIVAWNSDATQLRRLLDSLALEGAAGVALHVAIADNSVDAQVAAALDALLVAYAGRFSTLRLVVNDDNLGFGRAHNALARDARSDWLLLMNPDAALLPGTLSVLLAQAAKDADAAAFECRQQPYEHPKNYHPVTLETEWCSGAALLLRRHAFEAVGGFEAKLFLYGEDVDLSWRLRAAGWKLRFLPHAMVVHDSYRHAGEVKPAQVAGGTLANLLLRMRYGKWRDVREGYRQLMREIRIGNSFPGRRRALIGNLGRSLRLLPYFRRTRVVAADGFAPRFDGWDFERRRKGAFFTAPQVDGMPLVSVLIRTHRRPQWLREALISVERQTWPNIEIVVVEDGPDLCRRMLEIEFAHLKPRLRYVATGTPAGRAKAGNLALSLARGEWLNFLDDDDLLYADHVENLLAVARAEGVPGVYGIGWEVPTEVDSEQPLRYREHDWLLRFQMPFNHATLWVENFMPIQTVLFHRRLYERHGGFAEDMDQLEDWNLWTRYTLEDRFVLVDKTTSLYRVPAKPEVAERRQHALDEAYRDARERQAAMRAALSPALIIDEVRSSHTLNAAPTTRHLARRLAERFLPGRWLVNWMLRRRVA